MAATAELSLTLDPMGNSLRNLLVWNYLLNLNQTLLKWSLGGPLSELYPMTLRPPTKMAATAELSLTLDPMGNSLKNLV